jgi:hypothetical protein
MSDKIERLRRQHKEELDLAQEVIVNLRRDLANARKLVQSQGAVEMTATAAVAIARGKTTANVRIAKIVVEFIRSNKRPLE